MKGCLIHEMFGCIYAHLILEVGLCDLDNLFYVSYPNIENFWVYVHTYVFTAGGDIVELSLQTIWCQDWMICLYGNTFLLAKLANKHPLSVRNQIL